MNSANIIKVLADSLHPNTTHLAYQQLSQMRKITGFTVQLLLISDDHQADIAIRQSALIYLKNVVQDHCQSNAFLPNQDLQILKDSLLEALIRNVTNTKLTPTFREIIYQLTEKYYPKQWNSIVNQAVPKIESSSELTELLGAVQALKAVFSVFGGSVARQIQLGNLCNKTVIPLLGLASKLFQNFNSDTATILVSIFKLLSTAIYLHIPKVIQLNIHSLMIFVKKLLDIKTNLGDPSNSSLYILKRISLRIIFRIYQRHANIKLTSNKEFSIQFQAKYTKAFVQTLVLQVLSDEGSHDRLAHHRNMQLIKLSLSCIAYINRENPDAAALLMQRKDSLVRLCLQKFKLNFGRSYQNFTDFKLYVQQNRIHLKQFLFSLMRNDSFPNEQDQAVTSLLGLLLECLQKGDDQLKELSLYIFSEMCSEVQYLKNSLDQKMQALIIQYIKPLLKDSNHIYIRARACQMISNYNYLQLPEEHLLQIAQDIYTCVLVGNSEKETYLKIYACNAFNSIMKYPQIVEFIKPHLQDILRIYTSLLEVDVSIIKNFQDLLNLLQEDIAPFANDLVGLLIGLFQNYSRHQKNQQQQGYSTLGKQQEDPQEEDDIYEDEQDNNNQNIAKACISSIRQVLQAEASQLNFDIREKLFQIVVQIFADPLQLYIQEGYNILNLLLYKLQEPVQHKYYIFFRAIAYAILGLPHRYIQQLRKKTDSFSIKYADILQNVCVEPDSDLIQNSIGCLRNFIAKSHSETLRSSKDDFNLSLMDSLFQIVKLVHSNLSQKSSQTDRLIILTIYITLIEYRAVNEQQLKQIMITVLQWMRMEHQLVNHSNGNTFSTFGKTVKYTFTSVYLQIILLAVHFYGQTACQTADIHSVVSTTIALLDSFKCDYQLERVLIGLADILDNQLVVDNNILTALMNSIPEMVRRLCKLRQDGDQPENDVQMDQEAEEEKFFGDDDNSHMNPWQQPKPATANDLLLKGQDQEEEDDDWEEEFNKFYVSPLDKVDEIKYIGQVLGRKSVVYGGFMEIAKQEQLSLYLLNAPCKQNAN